MDRLPLEIRHMIADWTGHMSKGSLESLCLISREWNEIAKNFLNQHIILRLRDGKIPLVPDDRLILTKARQLSIVAEFTPRSYHRKFRPGRMEPKTSEKLDKEYSDIPCALERAFSTDLNLPKAGFYIGGDWSPVIDLIRQIPYLHEVNLFAFYGGPVELFEALSKYHPTCRVSFYSTLLHRHPLALQEGGMLPIINPVWLSSPMLYAVHLTVLENSDRMPLFVHPDRVLQNIVLHAPNLKKIALRIDSRHDGHTTRRQLDVFKVDQRAKSANSPGPARIETMSWSLHTEMTAEQFEDWQKITDFSVLRSLNVGCIRNSALLQSIVDDPPFRQLRRLTVVLLPQKDDDSPKFWQAAESMFNSLPPLTYLCLLGKYTPDFANNVICYRHGPTLHGLGLYGEIGPMSGSRSIYSHKLSRVGQVGPIFGTEHVQELANYCPSLQKLSICVQRYAGPQADMSSALGRFSSLSHLSLALNCLPRVDTNGMPIPLRELTEFEKGMAWDPFKWGSDVCPRWFIRDCMINCAMSESFVKEFFTQIRTCQESLVHLVMQPLFGQKGQHTELDHHSSFRWGQKRFMEYGVFHRLASIWTVKLDKHTELHATRAEPFNFDFLLGKYSDEILSIFRSTGILEAVAAVNA